MLRTPPAYHAHWSHSPPSAQHRIYEEAVYYEHLPELPKPVTCRIEVDRKGTLASLLEFLILCRSMEQGADS